MFLRNIGLHGGKLQKTELFTHTHKVFTMYRSSAGSVAVGALLARELLPVDNAGAVAHFIVKQPCVMHW
jgi:hypothetical protein